MVDRALQVEGRRVDLRHMGNTTDAKLHIERGTMNPRCLLKVGMTRMMNRKITPGGTVSWEALQESQHSKA